jgi:hypothetical protein
VLHYVVWATRADAETLVGVELRIPNETGANDGELVVEYEDIPPRTRVPRS